MGESITSTRRVAELLGTAIKALDDMSDTAGIIAPDVGDLASTLVEAQRIVDKASQDLQRLAKKLPKE